MASVILSCVTWVSSSTENEGNEIKQRLERLDKIIKPQSFGEWWKKDRARHPELQAVDVEVQVWYFIALKHRFLVCYD